MNSGMLHQAGKDPADLLLAGGLSNVSVTQHPQVGSKNNHISELLH